MSKNNGLSRGQRQAVITSLAAVVATIVVVVILVVALGVTKVKAISEDVEITTVQTARQFENMDDLQKTGYSFAGWYYDKEGVEKVDKIPTFSRKTVSVYARWVPNSYLITFDKQSGTGGTDNIDAKFDEVVPQVETPQRDAYNFAGYFTEPGGAGKQYYDGSGQPYINPENEALAIWDIPEKTTLYAKWIEKTETFTVTFVDADGETVLSTQTVQYSKNATPPVVTRA